MKDFAGIIEGKNRGLAGFSASAQGLFLHSVSYDWPGILLTE
jgi:hypothetical protein